MSSEPALRKAVPASGQASSQLLQPLLEQHGGETAVPFVIGVAILLDIADSFVERLAAQVERVGFQPRLRKSGGADRLFGMGKQLAADALPLARRHDVQGFDEVRTPMDQACDVAIDLGNGKFRPALVDVAPANIQFDVALRRFVSDVRQPCAFERFLQHPLQRRDIACLRPTHDVSILCHFPSPASRRVAFSAARHLEVAQADKDVRSWRPALSG